MLPNILSVVFAAVVCIMGVLWICVKQEERKHIRQGYWVEYLSPGRLRSDVDKFAVVYHEGEQYHFFDGRIGSRFLPDQLVFPDEETWLREVPDWLQDKRQIVLERILDRTNRIQIITKL